MKMISVPAADIRSVEFYMLKLRLEGIKNISSFHYKDRKKKPRLKVNAQTLRGFYASRRTKRMPITYELRWELSAKQRWKCAECKKLLPLAAQVDHVVPLCAGGDDNVQNMQVLCANCHAEKSRKEAKKGASIDRRILKHVTRSTSSKCPD